MVDREDYFEILRQLEKKPQSNQRDLATQLGVSLGKLNYCLKALKEKGLIKIKNFKKSPKKINYIYVLTPLGITTKTRLTVVFMKKKLAEYDELNKEFKLQKKSRFAKI